MPIDTSMYGRENQVEMINPLDIQQKAMNLSQMAMQKELLAKQMRNSDREMQQADKDQQYKDQMRKMSIVGNALESMFPMNPQERMQVYPKIRDNLVNQGIIGPQDAPPEYDDGFYRQYLLQYRQTQEYLDKETARTQIAKNQADAKRKETSDPLALFESRLALKDQYEQLKSDREMHRYANVQGWNIAEGATPTKDDAKKFKDSVTAAEGMQASLNRLQEITKKHGTELLPGAVKGEMDQLARDIQLQAKELYNLGVLNGPDLSLLEEVVTRPTSFKEAINPSGNKRASAGLARFGEMMKNRVNSQASVLGFQRKQDSKKLNTYKNQNARVGDPFLPNANAGQTEMPDFDNMSMEELLRYTGGK